jgi:hypothetical protein
MSWRSPRSWLFQSVLERVSVTAGPALAEEAETVAY